MELKDYRPISLIGSIYKIVAKILAERLKSVMEKLVSNQQNAFIKNRQITDASLIANEVMDWQLKRGGSGILCKLDIEKAFDQLNWVYLISILRQMGFGSMWIKFNTSTVKYSVLVNRSPVGFFSPQRGLRQGDPLSAKRLQWIRGFDVGVQSNINISHLLYADDTLIFYGADRDQVLHLNLTLLLFEALSGLHINMLKSVIYPVNEVHNLEELAGILGCNIGTLPTTYLGLPLRAKHNSSTIWKRVNEKFERRLASCKVLNQLDRIRKNFLWEGNSIVSLGEVEKGHSPKIPRRIGNQGPGNSQQMPTDEVALEVRLYCGPGPAQDRPRPAAHMGFGLNGWGGASDGRYSVKAGYRLIMARNGITDLWPWKLIWRTRLLPKVICFSWTALYEACLTQENLVKRNFHWVMPHNMKEAFQSWGSWKVDKIIKNIWKMIPAYTGETAKAAESRRLRFAGDGDGDGDGDGGVWRRGSKGGFWFIDGERRIF
uniref:Reverse transcriptase domain-containing protein n=1 Tax=Nicotiana tabacum TaxID=4097 RepID=A0A1S4APW4_TOBAC|nr:PREDICTED: uncharacterized protein LOC107800154 [Nicotiana tabacum]